MKIAVIGGGSSYTPELVEGLVEQAATLGLDELVLHDIDEGRLATVGGFCQRLAARSGSPVAVTMTSDTTRAVAGASFVVTQIRVGGQEARARDERLGRRHGLIGQETTGVGGFAKALRTIPVICGYADAVARHAPDAWIINFTNPSGIVTQALLHHGAPRAIGLCNIPIGFRMEIATALGIAPAAVDLDYVGLNHLSWIRSVRADGREITEQVLREGRRGGPANFEALDYPDWFVDALGMIPSDYLRYYYLTPELVAEQAAAPQTRADEVMTIEEELFRYYANPAHETKPAALSKRGGAFYSRAACELMVALTRPAPQRLIVNTANGGALSDLPDDAVVELPCDVSTAGARPVPVGALPPELRGLMAQVKAYEELTVRAAVEADRRAALLALVAHPLVPSITVAHDVLEEIVTENQLAL